MTLLYISYWGIDDVLTKATVLPNLRILSRHTDQIYLATIERSETMEKGRQLPGVTHVPFHSLRWMPRILRKATDLLLLTFRVWMLSMRTRIDLTICRGSSAAIFGILLHKLTSKPFIVESFEPHADYMHEAHVWTKTSLEFRLQRWVERQSVRDAWYLLPVSENYRNRLMQEGVFSERLIVMPCCVDMAKFRFNADARTRIRKRLSVEDDVTVGIYVGKFGDIYYREEAFEVFRASQQVFSEKFFLIILTPDEKKTVEEGLRNVGYDPGCVHIEFVPQEQVPGFLSAADFAFSLVRTSPSRKYCSPVKNGEYWANGLPVLLSAGVGDDEKIIRDEGAGVVIDIAGKTYDAALVRMRKLLRAGRSALESKIAPLAEKYRSFDLVVNGYDRIFSQGSFQKAARR